MRKTLFAFATSVLIAGVAFVGCGDDSSVDLGDMAGKSGDMAGGGGDMSVKFGCKGFITCFDDCLGGAAASFQGCLTTCSKQAKSSSVANKFLAARQCPQDHCQGDADAKTGACVFQFNMGSTTEGMLIDNPSKPAGACTDCLNNAFAYLYGMACPTMSSPDCKPSECTASADACLMDTP